MCNLSLDLWIQIIDMNHSGLIHQKFDMQRSPLECKLQIGLLCFQFRHGIDHRI